MPCGWHRKHLGTGRMYCTYVCTTEYSTTYGVGSKVSLYVLIWELYFFTPPSLGPTANLNSANQILSKFFWLIIFLRFD